MKSRDIQAHNRLTQCQSLLHQRACSKTRMCKNQAATLEVVRSDGNVQNPNFRANFGAKNFEERESTPDDVDTTPTLTPPLR